MYTIARAYASERQAEAAVADLVSELEDIGLDRSAISILSQRPPDAESPAGANYSESMLEALSFGYALRSLEDEKAEALFDAAMSGNAVVSVQARFGTSRAVETLLDRHEPLELEAFQEVSEPITPWDEAAPLSSALGIPVLSKRTPDPVLYRSRTFESIPALTRPGFAVFGNGVMRNNPTPLSSMFGMKTLSAPPKNWQSSFGLPLLRGREKPFITGPSIVKEPAPLSRLLRIPTLL